MTVIKSSLINICLLPLILSACGIFYSEGERLYDQGKYIEAIAEFDKYLEGNPYQKKALLLRSDSHTKVGNHKEALFDLNKARFLTDDLTQDSLLDMVSGNYYASTGKYDLAIAHYNKVIQADDHHKNAARYSRSWAHYHSEQYDMALADIDDSLSEEETATNYSTKALILSELGRLDKALENINNALELDEKSPQATSAKCEVQFKLKQYNQTIDSCLMAIELDPVAYTPFRTLGATYIELEKYDSAVEYLNQALEKSRGDHAEDLDVTYHNLSYSLLNIGDYEEALINIDNAIKLNPVSDDYRLRADILTAMGDHQKSLTNLDKSIELDPSNAFSHAGKCLSLYELGNYKKALNSCNQAVLDSDKKEADILLVRATINLELDNFEDALQDINIALQLNPNQNEYIHAIHAVKCATEFELKEYINAIESCSQAITLENETGEITVNEFRLIRALAYFEINDFQNSILDLNYLLVGPNPSPETYEFRSYVWEELGEDIKAQKDLEAAQKLRLK